MKRSEYNRLRLLQRAWQYNLRQFRAYNDMADSRLVVQMEHDAGTARAMQRRIDQLTDQLPGRGTDPLGFAPMYRHWDIRRKRVEYRCRARRRDAEQRARHDARYVNNTTPLFTLATTPVPLRVEQPLLRVVASNPFPQTADALRRNV